MPRKASGEPKIKLVERTQSNGDIYVYKVTTLYNPDKKYNEHISSKLLGKKSPDDGSIIQPYHEKPLRRKLSQLSVRQLVLLISSNGLEKNPI